MKKLILITISFCLTAKIYAQIGINSTNTPPNTSSMLDVSATNKGVLIPRMTTAQKNAIQNPVEGLMVYDTDVKQFSYAIAGGTGNFIYWVNFGNTQIPPSNWNVNGNDISNANTGNVGIGNSNPQSVLDVQGDIRFRSVNITLASGFSGELDAITIKASVYNLNSNVTITGITGGVDGRLITIVNTSAVNLIKVKLLDENDGLSTSTNVNKIALGNTFYIYQKGTIAFRYNGILQRWTVVSKNGVNDGTSATWQQAGNDLYNSNTGNVGIGTNSPVAKLDLSGSLRIGNGTEAIGKVLTSDANGFATWQTAASLFWSGDNKINDDYNFQTTYPLANKIVQINSPVMLSGGGRGNYKSGGLNIYNSVNGGGIVKYITLDGQNIQGRNLDYNFSGVDESEDNLLLNRFGGNVGIGTNNPTSKLSVNGNIRAKELVVESGWADYVFEKNYKLRSINAMEQFIQENKHLPNIPKASEIEKNGLKVGEMNKAMMEKIEELALYIIQLKKEVDLLKNKK